MSGASDAFVVIVHFGAVTPTLELANTVAGFPNAHVVVVANDGTPRPAHLAATAGWVPSANTGYFGALRVGLDEITTQRYVVLLNNDLEVPEETFRHCLDLLRGDPGLGVVGPVLNYPDGRRQSGAGAIDGLARSAHTRHDPGYAVTSCAWITGAAMFISRAAIERVGFDSGYFLGAEDLDLCVRMTSGGYRVACDGRVTAVHRHSAEIGSLWNYYSPRNSLWFARNHYTWLVTALTALRLSGILARVVAAAVVYRRGSLSTVLYLAGLRDGVLRRPLDTRSPLPQEPMAVAISDRWTRLIRRRRDRPSKCRSAT